MMHVVHLQPPQRPGETGRMNLARIRASRNLSQRALAEMIGVDAATIHRAEVMHSSAKLETYRKCAEALGVTLADLFADDRAALEAELLAIFRGIPEARHDDLVAMFRLIEGRSRQAS